MTSTSQVCYVYLLKCADGSYYCGSAKDLSSRLEVHNSGKGAKYTRARSRLPVELLESIEAEDWGSALKIECAVKTLPKSLKVEVFRQGRTLPIEQRVDFFKSLSPIRKPKKR